MFDNKNKLSIGTAQFGFEYGIANKSGIVSVEEGGQILTFAYNNGIRMLDTSYGYADSETKLGEIGVSEWQVVTKILRIPECNNIATAVEKNIQNSLDRLQIKSLYGVLLHNPDQLFLQSGIELYKALVTLKEKNVINKIGISVYSIDELDKLIHNYDFDIIQAPYNLFDRRLSESGWLNKLKNAKIEVHVRSIFLQGLLLLQPAERPNRFNLWKDLWDSFDKWLEINNISALDACLNFVLNNNEISKAIVGVDNLQNIQEIINAANQKIPDVPDYLVCNDLGLIDPRIW